MPIKTITNVCTNPRGRNTVGTIVIDPDEARQALIEAAQDYESSFSLLWSEVEPELEVEKGYAWTGPPNASPSTETIDGVVTRTNFAINPGPALPATGEAPVVGWVGLTRQGSAAAARSNSVYTENIAADSGEQWAASVVLTALNTPTTVRVDLRETASGAFGAQPYIATVMSVNLVPGVPQTVALGGTVSTSPSTNGLRLAFSGAGVSTNVAVGNTLITRGTTAPGTYFDGGTTDVLIPPDYLWIRLSTGMAREWFPPTPVIDYDWTDTPDASPSTETIDGVLTRTNLSLRPEPTGTGGFGWTTTSSANWPGVYAPGEGREGRDAVKTSRIYGTVNSNIAQLTHLGATSGGNAGAPRIEAGKAYTFSAYVKCTDVPEYETQTALWWLNSSNTSMGSTVNSEYVAGAPDSDGWTRVVFTSVAPVGAEGVLHCVYARRPSLVVAPEGTQVWFCDAQVEEVAPDRIYEWTGEADNSASVELTNGVETRRNYVPNPTGKFGSVSGWGTSTSTLSYDSTRDALAMQVGGNQPENPYTFMSIGGISPQNRIVGAYVETSDGLPVQMSVYCTGGTPSGTGQQTVASGSVVYTHHATTTGPTFVWRAWGLGDRTVYLRTFVMVDMEPPPGTYFDGSTLPVVDTPKPPTPFFYGDTPDEPGGGWQPISDLVDESAAYQTAITAAKSVGWTGPGSYYSPSTDSEFIPANQPAIAPGGNTEGRLVLLEQGSTKRRPLNGPIEIPPSTQDRRIRVAAVDDPTYTGPYFDGDTPPFNYSD